MNFRFEDPLLERLYVNGEPLVGFDLAILEYCLDALAVLAAARGIDDFSSLRAFRPVAVVVGHQNVLALSLGDDWRLIFTIEDDGTEQAMASIKSVCKSKAIESRRATK